MTYHVDQTARLADASAKSYAALKASLQAQGVPTRQHNVKTSKNSVAKKAATKKPAAKKSSMPAKKAATKKTAKKS